MSMNDNPIYDVPNIVMPNWWGDNRVHQSHRNNLYRKDPQYYMQFSKDEFISCCEKCNYFWWTHWTASQQLDLVESSS